MLGAASFHSLRRDLRQFARVGLAVHLEVKVPTLGRLTHVLAVALPHRGLGHATPQLAA